MSVPRRIKRKSGALRKEWAGRVETRKENACSQLAGGAEDSGYVPFFCLLGRGSVL